MRSGKDARLFSITEGIAEAITEGIAEASFSVFKVCLLRERIMGLRFWFGASGSGKTTEVQQEIIRRAGANRDTQFLMIVPDQFTMQTQKQMVTSHPDGGIINIDVLSFGRLAHRIFEEVGKPERQALDDTGKCLLLRGILNERKEEFPLLFAGLKNPGFIQEIKSVISEFMQYGLAPKDVSELAVYSKERKSLNLRLHELSGMYEAFLETCGERYITTEETLDLLCERLSYSELIRKSVVVFDGFTGFTPIQNKVIEKLLIYAREVNVTLVIDEECSPYTMGEETELFALSRKTVYSLQKLARENGISMGDDVILTGEVKRFINNPELAHLEKSLFRKGAKPYVGAVSRLEINGAGSVLQETGLMCKRLFELIEKEGYRYRDIAVITADMSVYEAPLRKQFEKYHIPYFIDNTKSLMQNPFVAFLRSAPEIVRNHFSYNEVFFFLRSGLLDYSLEDIDKLENYVRSRGIRGYAAWAGPFDATNKELKRKPEELEKLNEIRKDFISKITPLYELSQRSDATGRDYATVLYHLALQEKMAEKLERFAKGFAQKNDLSTAKEYEQIYKLIMGLLDQIVSLMGDEVITITDFRDILEAGLLELRVASLPLGVDLLMVGDMERTRLKDVKALFFLGVNDGKIPRAGGSGGLLSDLDREFLTGSGKELSPTPAANMFIQRLYLYMNLTKPSEYLWLSYASMSEDGTSLHPAYLISTLREMFPAIRHNTATGHPILSVEDEKRGFTGLLQGYFDNGLLPKERDIFLALYRDLKDRDEAWVEQMIANTLSVYEPSMLDRDSAALLFGEIMNCSISSLEKFASCQYAHFLQYGLCLREREEYGFEKVDMGNVTHEVLQNFGEELLQKKIEWNQMEEEAMNEAVDRIVDVISASYGSGILQGSAQNRYYTTRIRRILKRTVKTLGEQLRPGRFVPYDYEHTFRKLYEDKFLLKGKVDRIDLCRQDDEIFVKIIDYKTGLKDFDYSKLYYGTVLQLAVYMKETLEHLKVLHPEAELSPGAMLYYRIMDPKIKSNVSLSEEESEARFLKELNYKGLVNARAGIVDAMDSDFEKNSLVIPVQKGKDAEIKETDKVVNTEIFEAVLSYASWKAISLARDVKEGKISCNPAVVSGDDPCAYCAYQGACGFDSKLPGYEKEIKKTVDPKEVQTWK